MAAETLPGFSGSRIETFPRRDGNAERCPRQRRENFGWMKGNIDKLQGTAEGALPDKTGGAFFLQLSIDYTNVL